MNIHRYAVWLCMLATGATVAGCAGGDEIVHSSPPRPSPPAPLEQALLEKVNDYRARHGLKSLMMHEVLTTQARIHSQNMAKGKVRFGHDGFRQRAAEVRVWLSVMEIAENLAVNRGYVDPVAVAFESLMASPGHRKNIVGDFDLTGIGVAKSSDGTLFFTQMFADGVGRFR